MRGKCLCHKINPDPRYPHYSLIAILTELWQLTEGRKEGGGGGKREKQRKFFGGNQTKILKKNLYKKYLF